MIKYLYLVVIKANSVDEASKYLINRLNENIKINPFGTTIFMNYNEVKLEFSNVNADHLDELILAKWFQESYRPPFKEGDLLYYSVRKPV